MRWHLRIGGLSLAALALYGCAERYDPTLVLLPEGYRGPLVTIYDRPEGGPMVREDGRRVLRADSAGVILTAFPPTYGSVDEIYVSETAQGRCLYPPYHIDVKGRYPLCNDSISVWLQGTGGLGSQGNVASFAHGYVGTVAEAESLRVGALRYDPAEIVRQRLGID